MYIVNLSSLKSLGVRWNHNTTLPIEECVCYAVVWVMGYLKEQHGTYCRFPVKHSNRIEQSLLIKPNNKFCLVKPGFHIVVMSRWQLWRVVKNLKWPSMIIWKPSFNSTNTANDPQRLSTTLADIQRLGHCSRTAFYSSDPQQPLTTHNDSWRLMTTHDDSWRLITTIWKPGLNTNSVPYRQCCMFSHVFWNCLYFLAIYAIDIFVD